MSHAYHDALPGFDPAQILHDGCTECEWRGEQPARALGHLDAGNFRRAWERAAQWEKSGITGLSSCELPLLATLGAIQSHLERLGIPFGTLPSPQPLTPVEDVAVTVARNTAGRGEGISPNVAVVVMAALDRLTGTTSCGGCGRFPSAERCESCAAAEVVEDRTGDVAFS